MRVGATRWSRRAESSVAGLLSRAPGVRRSVDVAEGTKTEAFTGELSPLQEPGGVDGRGGPSGRGGGRSATPRGAGERGEGVWCRARARTRARERGRVHLSGARSPCDTTYVKGSGGRRSSRGRGVRRRRRLRRRGR